MKTGSLFTGAMAMVFVAGILLFAAACEGEPTPTPTPLPTATLTPMPTAAPTLTPTPIPPTPTPTPVPIDINELEITPATTVGNLLAAFSSSEVDCIRSALGAGAVDAVYNVPLMSLPNDTAAFPTECISVENNVGFAVALLSAESGGLSTETRSCISDIAAENPSIVGMGPPPENPAALFAGAIQVQLCLTDEEAAAFAATQGMELPPPSTLKCLEEQLGGEEAFLAALSDPETSEEAMFGMFAAAMACGQVIEPEVTPNSG